MISDAPESQIKNNLINQKPNVMITTYSECHSRFRFGRFNKEKSQQHQSINNIENKFQSLDSGSKSNQCTNTRDDEEEVATKSERSTDFFNQLKRSQTRQNHRILMDLSRIKGPTGSIRGHKDVVRKSLEEIKVASSRRLMFNMNNSNLSSLSTFMSSSSSNSGNYYNFPLTSITYSTSIDSAHLHQPSLVNESFRCEYLDRLVEDEQNFCVAYTTSLGVIRRTYEDSKLLKSILNLNLIKFEERDIYLNQEYKFQLKVRCHSIVVPALFVDGHFVGGVREVEAKNENGDLQRELSKFKLSTASKDVCLCCGNAKFIACPSCNGSRKSAIHHFKYNSIALRCIKCDKNDGLVQCPRCHSQSHDNNQQQAMDALIKSTGDIELISAAKVDSLGQKATDENNNVELEEKLANDGVRI